MVLRAKVFRATDATEATTIAVERALQEVHPVTGAVRSPLSIFGDASGTCAIVLLDDHDRPRAVAVAAARTDGACAGFPPGTYHVAVEMVAVDDATEPRPAAGAIWAEVVETMFAQTGAPLLIAFADARDRRQPEALEDAGFAWDEIVDRPGVGRAWRMVANPPAPRPRKRATITAGASSSQR